MYLKAVPSQWCLRPLVATLGHAAVVLAHGPCSTLAWADWMPQLARRWHQPPLLLGLGKGAVGWVGAHVEHSPRGARGAGLGVRGSRKEHSSGVDRAGCCVAFLVCKTEGR